VGVVAEMQSVFFAHAYDGFFFLIENIDSESRLEAA
jgi:hypothetical protein